MITLSEMSLLVAEISRAIDDPIQWVEDHDSMREHDAIAYTGRGIQNDGGGWIFVLVDYPAPDASSRRVVTGTATRLGTVMNLPPELVKKAHAKART
jgi:hypothetical protein